MRYVSKAEKERQRWMTLVEAINSITSKRSCDQREAVDDLFRVIADNNVKARLGNWSSGPDSLDGFNVASPYDFQGKIKVCLEAPGCVRLDSRAAKTKYPIGHLSSYAKVEIVDGPVVDIVFDQDTPIPDVNTSDYWPLLVSRDDIQKWPFVSDEEPNQALSAPTQIPEIPDKTLSHSGGPGRPTSKHLVKLELTRRIESGQKLAKSKIAEAESLSDWLASNHRGQPGMSAKTILNGFSTELNKRVVEKSRPK
jgi:hypothetical protein